MAHAIFRLSRKHRAMVSDDLRPLGLYAGQELLLLQLPEDGCRSQQALVEALGLDHSTVTKMLQRLERAGVVAREQSAEDRRVSLVRLTAEGCRARREVVGVWGELERRSTATLSERQRRDLLRLLRLVEEHLDVGR